VLVSGKIKEFKLLPTIKVTELLHPMLPSLTLKDLLVMPQKIKLLKTQLTQSSMLRDLLEENSMIQLFKKISNYGHSKLNLDPMTNQLLLLSTKEKPRNSTQKKFLPWF